MESENQSALDSWLARRARNFVVGMAINLGVSITLFSAGVYLMVENLNGGDGFRMGVSFLSALKYWNLPVWLFHLANSHYSAAAGLPADSVALGYPVLFVGWVVAFGFLFAWWRVGRRPEDLA